MLINVPTAIHAATRRVVLRHPNSMPCWVFRKVVTRVETDPDTGLESTMGGAPTLGGMGVLSSEDEDEFDYVDLGEGRCKLCGVYQPNDQVERDNALLQPAMQEAQVESLAAVGEAGHFVADVGDIVMVTPGLGVVLVSEVVSISGTANIPPYIQRLVLNPRDDLHQLTPFLPGAVVPVD